LGLLFLAAQAGETTLKGMVEWIHLRLEEWMRRYVEELDLWDVPRYITFYRAIRRVDVEALTQALQVWLSGVLGEERGSLELWYVDGKVLRGTRRSKGPAGWEVLHVLSQAAGHVKEIIDISEGKGEETALVEWLVKQPSLEGKVLTLDAGLMDRPVVTQVVAKKGGPSAG